MSDLIDVPDEAVRLAGEAIEDEAMRRIGRDLGTLWRDDIARAGLLAALPVLRAQIEAETRDEIVAEIEVRQRQCPVDGTAQAFREWSIRDQALGLAARLARGETNG